ncbi:hypothetical protein TorRG33x02_332580 [Trema orientale]|uniref:Uncharacterized protein n=1 Tax=Trema orientale TaxID=63057 RepID=A0A2P5B526_TREOI|nr:hypothetical protein TorRG33x02_332580 [Trema orientale]
MGSCFLGCGTPKNFELGRQSSHSKRHSTKFVIIDGDCRVEG